MDIDQFWRTRAEALERFERSLQIEAKALKRLEQAERAAREWFAREWLPRLAHYEEHLKQLALQAKHHEEYLKRRRERIPFTIRVWTRPHSARLSEPAADGGQTGARPRTDAAQVRRPILPFATFLLFSSGSESPPPLLLSSDTSFARAALGFFPLPHRRIRFHDGTASPPRRAAAIRFGPGQMVGSASAVTLRS